MNSPHAATALTALAALTLTPLTPALAAPVPDPSGTPDHGATGTIEHLTDRPLDRPTDQLLVKFAADAGETAQQVALRVAAAAVGVPGLEEAAEVRPNASGAMVLRLPEALPLAVVERAAVQLAADPAVEWAEADRIVLPDAVPADDRYTDQWEMPQLNMPAVWDHYSGKDVVIGVSDTGITSHPDLDANVIGGYDFVADPGRGRDGDGRDGDATDQGTWEAAGQCYQDSPAVNSIWHGTHVSGTAAAAVNGTGVVGVSPGARILTARTLGVCGGKYSDLLDGLYWMIGSPVPDVPPAPRTADVINMSMGWTGTCPTSFQTVVDTAVSRGVPVVVSAGNSGVEASTTGTAGCRNVIAVGASTVDGARASYSNHGSAVDVYAPGGDRARSIISSGNSGTTVPIAPAHTYLYGTSMAAPHVAGLVALLKHQDPSLTPDQIEARMKDTADQLPLGGSGELVIDPQEAAYAPQGAIGALYTGIKASTGRPTGPQVCDLPGAGCRQPFTTGSIYWSEAAGAHWVRGAVGRTWDRLGGVTGSLGYPASDEVSNGIGGVSQLFERGRIVWSSSTGAHELKGAIGARHEALGGEKGPLGYPVSGETANGIGGYSQLFERGRIVWSSATGAKVLKGAVRVAYDNAGAETGHLGYPTGDERAGLVDGGVHQQFQNGKIYWSSRTGAHPVKGAIGARYAQLGSENSALGYPMSSEYISGSSVVQSYQGGRISWTSSGGTQVSYS